MTTTIWKTLFGQADNPEDLKGQTSLSEEACGDLIHSLTRLGYLSNIVTSLDGNTFITHDQLDNDILSQLEMRNGRVSVLDLPRILNANSSDIQDRIQGLIRSRPGRMFHVQDELIRLEYLQDMTSQLNSELSRRGFFTALEMSRNYKFGIDFVRQFLKDRVGKTISGQWDVFDRGLVVAPWFHEQEKATLLSALYQLKEPTSIALLRAKNIVQDQLLYGLCDILAKETELPGRFKGVGEQGVFVPEPYTQQQTEWIETFFKDNGFIELDAVKKHGVTDPKTYMQSNHPTALILETHVVKQSIWSIVDASVEDTIANLSWIDIKPLVPSPLTKEDISRLLGQLPSLSEPTTRIPISSEQDPSLTGLNGGSPQETLVIQDSIVVTSGQLQKCLLRMGPLLDRKAKAFLSWRLSFGDDPNMDDIIGEQDSMDGFMCDVTSLKDLMNQSFAFMSAANTASGQGSRKNQKGKQIQHHLYHQQQGIKLGGKNLQELMTIQDVRNEIREMEPDFDSALVNTTAGILYRDLLQNLKVQSRSMVLKALEDEEKEHESKERSNETDEVQTEKQEYENMRPNFIITEIMSLLKRIQLSSKGIDAFEDATIRNSLSKYLLQTLCVELLDLVTLYLACLSKDSAEASDNPLSKDAEETRDQLQKAYLDHHLSQIEASSPRKGPFSLPSDAKTLLMSELIPKNLVDPLKKLCKLTAGSGKQKNLVEYLDVWSGFAHNSESRLEKIDMTDVNDSAKLLDHLGELRRALTSIDQQEPQSAALILHIVTLIVFQKWTGHMLHASGKYVPRILRQLRSILEKQEQSSSTTQLELLEKMLEQVLSSIKQSRSENEPARDQNAEQLWQTVHDLGINLTK
ncbi:E3 UFM1-protein ligase 1 [Linnemannia zychae]|nr:E3 UFM1-protein ligase 1 [Linnemannia zychae]